MCRHTTRHLLCAPGQHTNTFSLIYTLASSLLSASKWEMHFLVFWNVKLPWTPPFTTNKSWKPNHWLVDYLSWSHFAPRSLSVGSCSPSPISQPPLGGAGRKWLIQQLIQETGSYFEIFVRGNKLLLWQISFRPQSAPPSDPVLGFEDCCFYIHNKPGNGSYLTSNTWRTNSGSWARGEGCWFL